MKNIKIFTCPTAENFTKEICQELNLEIGKIKYLKFSNDNNFVQILETVRGQDVYILFSFFVFFIYNCTCIIHKDYII